MILKMFSIYDAKAEYFNTPFFQKTHGEAERSFQSTVNDDRTMLNKHPEDFDLYYLGDYDDKTGVTQALDTPKHVLKAISMIAQSKKPLEDVSKDTES